MTRRLTLLLLVPIILCMFVSPAFAKGEAVSVYYAGEADSSVMRALELAGFTLADEPAQAQVILLNGSIPDAGALAVQLQAGKGLVLILGDGTSTEDIETLLGFPVAVERREEAASLTEIEVGDPLTSEILWNSAASGARALRDALAGLRRPAAGDDL